MKNKSIFLFLAALIFPLLLQAAGTEKDIKPCGGDGATIFDGCYPIYMYEDTKVANSILNSIASFFSQGSADYVVNTVLIISTAIIVLKVIFPMMFGMGTLSFFGSGQTRGEVVSRSLLYNILFILFVWLLLGPNLITRSVHVIDARVSFGGGAAAVGVGAGMGGRPISGPTIQKIDNVPIIIAFPVSTASILGKELILMMDSFYAPLDGLKFTDIGFQEQYDILEKTADVNALNRLVKKINTVQPSFIDNFRKYYEDCYIPYHNSSAGAKIEGESLRGSAFKSFDSFAPVDSDYQLRAAYFKKEGSGGSLEVRTAQGNYLSCINFWDTYVKKNIKQIDDIIREEQTKFTKFNITVNSDTLDSLVYKMLGTDSADNVITKSKNNSSLFSQALMSPMINGAHEMAVNNLSGEPLVLSNMQMAINKSLNDTALDTTAAGAFTISMKAFPKLFLNYWIVLVALMPIGFLFMTFLGPKAGIGYLITYFGSLLIVEIARMGLALAHNIGATIGVDENIAKYNLAANTSTISPVDSQWIRDQALTANYYAGFATVVVLVTAAIVFRAGRGVFNMTMNQPLVKSPLMSQSEAGNSAARVSEEVAMMERARLNGDKDASIGSLYASSQMAQELEAANRAYGDYVKMNQNGADGKNNMRSHLFNTQQDGASAAYSSIAKGEERLSEKYGGQSRAAERVEGAARIQGISSASQEMQMGKGFDSSTGDFASQAIKDRNGRVIGQGSKSSLARAMGQNEAVKWEQSARGFVSNGAHDKDGLLNDSLEAQKYLAGLEAQSRISTNQIMGTGRKFLNDKGEAAGATREDMMNIQRVAHHGVNKQIEQGRALGATFENGKGRAAFDQESMRVSYAEAHKAARGAQALADAYNISRDKFGDDFYRRDTAQKMKEQFQGIHQGIDGALKNASQPELDKLNAAKEALQLFSATGATFPGLRSSIRNALQKTLDDAQVEYDNAVKNAETTITNQGAANISAQMQEGYTTGGAKLVSGYITPEGQLDTGAMKYIQDQELKKNYDSMCSGNRLDEMRNSALAVGQDQEGTAIGNEKKAIKKRVDQQNDDLARSIEFRKSTATMNIQGTIADENFNLTAGGASTKYKNTGGDSIFYDIYGVEKGTFIASGTALGGQIGRLIGGAGGTAGGPAGTVAGALSGTVAGATLGGLAASALHGIAEAYVKNNEGGEKFLSVSGSTNSQLSHSQGYSVNGGSALVAAGQSLGLGMGTMASIQSGFVLGGQVGAVGATAVSGAVGAYTLAQAGAQINSGGSFLGNLATGTKHAVIDNISQNAGRAMRGYHNSNTMRSGQAGGFKNAMDGALKHVNLSSQDRAVEQAESGVKTASAIKTMGGASKAFPQMKVLADQEGKMKAGEIYNDIKMNRQAASFHSSLGSNIYTQGIQDSFAKAGAFNSFGEHSHKNYRFGQSFVASKDGYIQLRGILSEAARNNVSGSIMAGIEDMLSRKQKEGNSSEELRDKMSAAYENFKRY